MRPPYSTAWRETDTDLEMDLRNELARHQTLATAVALVLVTLALYWPIQDHDFLLFDDPVYITANPRVSHGLSPENTMWAFKTLHAGNWHPLTWLSHMVDCELYGLNPAGHHYNNLLIHAANSLLLFLVLGRITGRPWRSAFVAALFAWHPVHVESVAWVSERKNLLSTLFWILTIWAYCRYAKAPTWSRYLLSLLLFGLGLLAKPMLVTLPFILLLLDYWPLRRHLPKNRPAADDSDISRGR